jgi:hypothetical protein
MASGRGNFSQLQHLLQLSYSENPDDQQKVVILLYLTNILYTINLFIYFLIY